MVQNNPRNGETTVFSLSRTKQKARITPITGKQLAISLTLVLELRITPITGKQPVNLSDKQATYRNNPHNGETTLRNVDITTSIF